MKARALMSLTIALFLLLPGCDDSSTPTDGGSDQDADGHVAADEGGDEGADEGADEVTDQDVSPISISLPQSVSGAMLANPLTYSEIPLRIATVGGAESVTVNLDGTDYPASDPGPDSDWVAMLPIESLEVGSYQVVATAEKAGVEPATAEAELVISRIGTQMTWFDEVGPAGTPRIHRRGDEVYLTWTDTHDSIRTVWLRGIDGAGRWMGDAAVPLFDDGGNTVYGRTAFGNDSVGIMYQQPDGPWEIFFMISDFEGNQLLAPIDLVPQDLYGSFGGDIVFDGEAYVLAWRVNDGTGGGGQIHWMRITESDHTVTGPVIVAASGNDDPIGGFDAFSFTKVASNGSTTLVTFVRKLWNQNLGMSIPKSYVSQVSNDGTVVYTEQTDIPGSMQEHWMHHRECRVFAIDDQFIIIWSRKDLNSPEMNIPNWIYATTADAEGNLDPDRGMGVEVLNAPRFDREEFQLVPHPGSLGIMTWLDNRSEVDPDTGKIELFAAELQDDLTVTNEKTFRHAVFIFGVTQLVALPYSTNVLLVWLDERHGNGLLDPKPEVWFETAWY